MDSTLWRRASLTSLTTLATVVAAGCAPAPFVADGTSFGPSEPFTIDAGTQAISWSAWDGAAPADGCLFGLLLDSEEPPADGLEQPNRFPIPKLAYQVLGDGETLNDQAVLELPAGQYRFVIEGSCYWSVRVDRH